MYKWLRSKAASFCWMAVTSTPLPLCLLFSSSVCISGETEREVRRGGEERNRGCPNRQSALVSWCITINIVREEKNRKLTKYIKTWERLYSIWNKEDEMRKISIKDCVNVHSVKNKCTVQKKMSRKCALMQLYLSQMWRLYTNVKCNVHGAGRESDVRHLDLVPAP